MVVLDVAIVNVALPSIKTDLHFTQSSLQWVITAYALMFGGFLLLGGRMADLLGRRRLFIAGVILFTASSLLAGFAWSEGSLIAFRATQGLGGALLAPAALSILTTMFAEGRERNIALGVWGAVSGSGAAAGVLLGGLLTSWLAWSWIFFINVPVGIAVVALSPFLLRESRADLDHRHFDVSGAITVTGGLMLLVYAMTRATTIGWGTAETIGLLTALRGPDRRLRRDRAALEGAAAADAHLPAPHADRANVTAFLLGTSVFSQFFLGTLYMQQVLHFSAIETGVAYLPLTLTIIALASVSQNLVTRVGVRRVLPVGLAFATVGLLLLTQLPADGHYFFDLFPAFLVSAVGLAFAFIPMTIAALMGVEHADAGVASGLLNTTQQIGGAIGLAAVSTIATTFTTHYVDAHPGSSPLGAAALTHGFNIAFYVLTGVAALAAVLSAVLIESQPAAPVVETEFEAVPIEEAA